MKNTLICLLACSMFVSCRSFKSPSGKFSLQQMSEQDLSRLNGRYATTSTDSTHKHLEYNLMLDETLNNRRGAGRVGEIVVEMISPTRCRLSLYEGEKCHRSKVVRGNWQQPYFVFRRQYKIGSFWGLFNGLNFTDARIALHRDGDLVVDYETGGIVFLLLIPLGGAGDTGYDLKFRRLPQR